jgi:hypothetical protein
MACYAPDAAAAHASIDLNEAWAAAGGLQLNMQHPQLEPKRLGRTNSSTKQGV